jgi:hypothetical protein
MTGLPDGKRGCRTGCEFRCVSASRVFLSAAGMRPAVVLGEGPKNVGLAWRTPLESSTQEKPGNNAGDHPKLCGFSFSGRCTGHPKQRPTDHAAPAKRHSYDHAQPRSHYRGTVGPQLGRWQRETRAVERVDHGAVRKRGEKTRGATTASESVTAQKKGPSASPKDLP